MKVSSHVLKMQRESLPVFEAKARILEAVADNKVVIVVGETGSGKTTQIPQYLFDAGYAKSKVIACSQPRRLAAVTVARRVSDEFGCKLGKEVGYKIRFENCTSGKTVLKYMTDGVLLRECLTDLSLSAYSVVILDEAHERTVENDVLFALVKSTLRRGSSLKVIVSSATLDAQGFSEYFSNAPILRIPGRMHEVRIHYLKENVENSISSAIDQLQMICSSSPSGDVLVFLPGQGEIEEFCEKVEFLKDTLFSEPDKLAVFPLYAALPSEKQAEVFTPSPEGTRKVIVATNIAETSLTIEGVKYVIDSGLAKVKMYRPSDGVEALVVRNISQAQADQRAGRAGRTAPGECFRIYSQNFFETQMPRLPVPEIQRSNLASIILMLKRMGVRNIYGFQFIDAPSFSAMRDAVEQLQKIGALADDESITDCGMAMTQFPLEPNLSRALLASVEFGCSEEMLTIAAMLSVEGVFYRPKRGALLNPECLKFNQKEGDLLTLLAIYNSYKSAGGAFEWCRMNKIHLRAMKKAEDIRYQLSGIMRRNKVSITSCRGENWRLQRAILEGYKRNAARCFPEEDIYKTVFGGLKVYVHPTSAFYGEAAGCVVFVDLLEMSGKRMMRNITEVLPEWIDKSPDGGDASAST